MGLLADCINITVNVERLTEDTTNGEVSKEWAVNLTSQGSRKRQLSGREQQTNSRVGFTAEDVFYFDTAPDIKEGDRIVYDSQYYYIGRVYNPHESNEFLQVYTGTIVDQI